MSTIPFQPGDPVPMFVAPTGQRAEFTFNSMGGRYVVLFFMGRLPPAEIRTAVDLFTGPHRQLFDDGRASFFGVSSDAETHAVVGPEERLPGIRFFRDFSAAVSRAYGMADGQAGSLVLDPTLRVLAVLPFEDAHSHVDHLVTCLAGLPGIDDHAGTPLRAPVLIVPRVFEPDLCHALIEAYRRDGGTDSGFMNQTGGRTVGTINHAFKRRSDLDLPEGDLRTATRQRIVRRLLPEIGRAFQFRATRIERYLVACYDSGRGGFFRPHRDNTTKGTAHRQFAVTFNLNSEDYAGGDLRFPEYGSRSYRAPTGGAIVFSCSLLHEALPVTAGRRYAFLPFLYGEAAARIRQANAHFISADTALGSRMDIPGEPSAWMT